MASALTTIAPKIFEKVDEKVKAWGPIGGVSCLVCDCKGQIVAKHLTKTGNKIFFTTGYGKVRALISNKGWKPSNMIAPYGPLLLRATCWDVPALLCCGATFPYKGTVLIVYKDDAGQDQRGFVTISGCVFAHNDVLIARYAVEQLGYSKSQEDAYEYIMSS